MLALCRTYLSDILYWRRVNFKLVRCTVFLSLDEHFNNFVQFCTHWKYTSKTETKQSSILGDRTLLITRGPVELHYPVRISKHSPFFMKACDSRTTKLTVPLFVDIAIHKYYLNIRLLLWFYLDLYVYFLPKLSVASCNWFNLWV